MNFDHPKMLWLLAVALPLLGLFLWRSWRRKQFLISQFVRSRLLAHLTVGLSRTVQKTRMALLVLAVGCLILTLAQPQWGFAWEEVRQRGLDIVVAIDTSRSMLAEDIAPNRLQRAKLAALDLMRLAKRDRLGLVAFAGTAFLQCPLTLDDEAFRQSVNQLDVGIIPQGGTALAEAIQTAQSAFKEETDNHRVLVLFTDGEDHESGAVEAAEKAASAGLRIFTVGVGTPNGELLRQRDEKGNLSYVKDDQGNVVKSRLNEILLTQIATKGDGFYLPMSGASTVDVLYQRGLAPLPRSESATKLIKQFKERYQWPLTLAILLLLLEMFLPDRRRVRRSEAMVTATNPELRKMVALLALGLSALQVSASPSGALRKYESGQFKDAYQEYSRLLQRHPDDVRLHDNAGAAAYQARKYQDAVKHFSAAMTAPDLHLQEHAYYNLGNSLYKAGEEDPKPEDKVGAWEQSTEQFKRALKLDPKDADAKANLEFVEKQLEELKRQQQQQKQQSKDNKDQKDQKDKKQDQDNKDQDKSQQDQKSKESQSNPDQKDQDKKNQAQNQPEQKQQDQQKKQDKASKSQEDKKDKEQQAKDQASQQSAQKQNANSDTNGTATAESGVPGEMSPEEAKRLLDSQKGNEKVLIFIPPEAQKNAKRIFKDW